MCVILMNMNETVCPSDSRSSLIPFVIGYKTRTFIKPQFNYQEHDFLFNPRVPLCLESHLGPVRLYRISPRIIETHKP